MGVFDFIAHMDLVQLDIEKLVDALKNAGDADVVFELYCHLRAGVSSLLLRLSTVVFLMRGKKGALRDMQILVLDRASAGASLGLRLRMTVRILIMEQTGSWGPEGWSNVLRGRRAS